MDHRARPRIELTDDEGRPVGSADIDVVDDTVARASVHVESGHVAPTDRARLVDAVLDAPEVSSRSRVELTLPLGEAEMLDRVRERSTDQQARAAGASCLVDAELPDPTA